MPATPAYITLDDVEVYDPAELIAEVERQSAEGLVHGIDLTRVRGRANGFVFPRGFDPGRGYVLMTRSDASALSRNTADHSLAFTTGGSGGATVTFSKLLIEHIEELTGTDQTDNKAICLVELADLRVLGQFTSINKAYNVLYPDESDYYNFSADGGSPWTYQSMIEDIWDLMPASFGALNTADADFPSGTPNNYVFRGCTAWDALRKVCDDIQHVLVLTRAGNFQIVAGSTTIGDYENDKTAAKPHILCGSNDIETTASSFPEKVRVFFPRKDKAWYNNSEAEIFTHKDHWLSNPLYSIDVDTSSVDANITTITGTVHPIHDSLVAIYNEAGSLTNSTALSNRATEVAENYINALSNADNRFNYRYSGVHSFTPDTDLACVAYYDFGSGLITETRGVGRKSRISPILETELAGGQLAGSKLAFENNSSPHLTQHHVEGERFTVVDLQAELAANSSATGRVQFGTGSPITWADATPTRNITVFNLTDTAYESGTRVLCWFDHQTRKWLVVTTITAETTILFRNVDSAAGTMPAYGLGQVTGTEVIGSELAFTVVRPAYSLTDINIINGGDTVAYNATGRGYWGLDRHRLIVFDSAHGPAAINEQVGPWPGSWGVRIGGLGFYTRSSGSGGTIYVIQQPVHQFIGKLYGTLNKNGNASAKLRLIYGDGSGNNPIWHDMSELVTVTDGFLNTGESIPIDTIIVCQWYCTFWVVVNAYCDPDDSQGSQNVAMTMLAPQMIPTFQRAYSAAALRPAMMPMSLGATGVP
jgi:hypothetical protein